MKKALIVAPQWIGDAVMSEPLLRVLHLQNLKLTVLALPWVAPVYEAMPCVSRVVVASFKHGHLDLKYRFNLAKSLRDQFDAAWVLPNSFKGALVPYLAKIPKRLGYVGEMRYGLLTETLSNPGKERHLRMVDFYSNLAQLNPFALPHHALQAQDTAQDEALTTHAHPQLMLRDAIVHEALATYKLSKKSYICIVPGAEFGQAKRWPSEYFAQLVVELTQQHFTCVLLGSKKDEAVCAQIVQQMLVLTSDASIKKADVLNLAGQTHLLQAMALIAASRCVVSNDSGLMHIAAAFNCAQVALFGSSSPRHTPPLNHNSKVLWLKDDAHYQPPLTCAPCFKKECPLGHLRCLRDLSVQTVLQSVLQVV